MGRLQELRKKFNVPEPKQPTAEQIARLHKTKDIKSELSTPHQAGNIYEPFPLEITPGNQEHARRRVNDHYNTPKPAEPKAFDFGLTEERVNELKQGKSFGVIGDEPFSALLRFRNHFTKIRRIEVRMGR
jgi:hypothetical protein